MPMYIDLPPRLEQGGKLGFAQVLLTDAYAAVQATTLDTQLLKTLFDRVHEKTLDIWLELSFDSLPIEHVLVARYPDLFTLRHGRAHNPIDPRREQVVEGRAFPRFDHAEAEPLIDWWVTRAKELIALDVDGFLLRRPQTVPPLLLSRLIEEIRASTTGCLVIAADLAGMTWDAVETLKGCTFDFCLSSLPWWDGKASWLVQEHAVFSAIAPVIAQVADWNDPANRPALDPAASIRLAPFIGAGWLMPIGCLESATEPLTKLTEEANHLFEAESPVSQPPVLQALTGPGAAVTAILRTEAEKGCGNGAAFVILINQGKTRVAAPTHSILAQSDVGLTVETSSTGERFGGEGFGFPLDAGDLRIVKVIPSKQVVVPDDPTVRGERLTVGLSAPRILIQDVQPSVDGYAVKRTAGEALIIEADIFADGHEQLAAWVAFKADDADAWSQSPMTPIGNDRWRASVALDRIGSHAFTIEAWVDIWGGFVRDFAKKRDAGLDLKVDIVEGIELIRSARKQAKGPIGSALAEALKAIDQAAEAERPDRLLSPDLRNLMRQADKREFDMVTARYPVQVERRAARFSSWYELFPRSVTHDPAKPGRLLDVIGRLPAIKKMGFDVLYFPPIHPIGTKNRKGRNNSLTSVPGDPGSPYAIGSEAGGHDAINPELGTLDDFKTLVAAARMHGLEIALDFAVQCAPDHPWLKDHPKWFAWRADGSMKYAENPPKKYEDIVNVDFYAKEAVPDLWIALRDIVSFWVSHGVKIFRVDNPHTKPLPFWEWLIGDIRGAYPDTIFLAEAFTRPKIMYHLAKIGFSQSYSYFTWRNTKAELTNYLEELNAPPVREFFRPHFFVNTPDINPYFLQQSGRAGFLTRAALAATLSGLWGLYSGFELCEFEALPGKEEYKDSEKYEIRPRDWRQPGNIIAEIAQLNRIRLAEPALQSHLGVTFYNAFNDQVIYYGKVAEGQQDKILVAVTLDPHHPQETSFEIPLWEWGLSDDAEVDVFDLLSGTSFLWRGKIQQVRLTPQSPYAIWRIQPRGEA